MADLSRLLDTDGQGNSLQALLAAIDRETAPALAQDAALLRARAAQAIRRKQPHITFLLGDDEMALSIDSIQEIGYLPTVTPLPNLPLWIKGIVQIRGEILSVVDFLLLLGRKEERGPLRRSYVLYRQGDFKFCLVVDKITGVVNLDEQRDPLLPFAPDRGGHLVPLAPFCKGLFAMDNRTVCILDDEKLGASSLIRKWQ